VKQKGMLAAALMAGFAGAALATPGDTIRIQRGEVAPELGLRERRYTGYRERSQRVKHNRKDAYKAQRRANRLRRKALGK
jgi:hypothetical protein